jgi:hypothetical protein
MHCKDESKENPFKKKRRQYCWTFSVPPENKSDSYEVTHFPHFQMGLMESPVFNELWVSSPLLFFLNFVVNIGVGMSHTLRA